MPYPLRGRGRVMALSLRGRIPHPLFVGRMGHLGSMGADRVPWPCECRFPMAMQVARNARWLLES